MRDLCLSLMEPKHIQKPERLPFSNRDIQKMIVPLFFEQLLVMLVGIADTFMISYAGDAAVSNRGIIASINAILPPSL